MSDSMCPSRDDLFAYLVGTLPEDAAETISRHVDQCTVCQQTLLELDESEDSVVAKLRCRDGEDPFANEPQRHQVLARAKMILAAQEDPADIDTISLDLGPSEDPYQWGEFQLLEELDRGGQGAVYKALQTKLQRTVALKVLRPERMANPEFQARFEREMVAIGQLDHPNIVRPMHAGEHNGIAYLVMEYVDGISLSDLVERHGPLAVADACELVRQAAVGLQYAHEHGLVHRDIKPSNLMLAFGPTRNPVSAGDNQPEEALPSSNRFLADEPPTLKILDLGLSRVNAEQVSSTQLTAEGQVMGTPDYVAPEQVLDARNVDIRADIYSLGCTLYKLLAGKAPFQGSDYPDTRRKVLAHIQEPAAPIQDRRKDVPADLVCVIERMLAKEPDDRCATPAEVADVLRPFAEDADLAGCWACALSPAERRSSEDQVEMPTDEYRSSAGIDTETRSRMETPSTKCKGSVLRWLALAGASVFVVALGTVIYLNTGQGQIELTVNEPGYRVILDGKECRIESVQDQLTVKIPVSAGRHDLRVTKPGFKPDAYAFRIFRNGKEVISARLVPTKKPEPRPVKVPDPASSDWKLWKPGPADNVMMGLAARPAQFPGIRRWQLETVNPRGTVRSVAWSPDGTMLACCSQDAQVRVYDVRSGKLIRLFTGHTCGVSQVAWCPDGRWLASCGDKLNPKNKRSFAIRLWDVDNGKPGEVLYGHTGDIQALAWSPDGKRLASASRDNGVRIWDLATAQRTASLAMTTLPKSLSWAPDGLRIAIGGYNGTLWLWDAVGDDQKTCTTIQADEPYLGPVAWSPTGEWIATAGGPNVTRIRLWRPDGKTPMMTALSPTNWTAVTESLAWSRDGRTLLGGCRTCRFFTWKVGDEAVEAKHPPKNLKVSSVAWAPHDGTVAVGCGAGAIYLWTPGTNDYRLLTGYTPRILATDWNPDGQQLVVGCNDGSLGFWDSALEVASFHAVHDGVIRDVAWSPDGQWIASGGDDSRVRLLRAVDRTPGPVLLGPDHDNAVLALAWSPDGRTLASGSVDETIRLWSPEKARWKDTLEGDFGQINALAWQPNGQTLASASDDRNIRFWSFLEDPTEKMRKPTIYREKEGDHNFAWLSWSADGRRLAAGCGGAFTSFIRLLNSNGEKGRAFRQSDETREYRGMAWRPGSDMLALRLDEGFVLLIDGETEKQIDEQPSDTVTELSRLGMGRYPGNDPPAWTSSGSRLAAVNEDSTVEVFDINSERPVWTFVVLPDRQAVAVTSAGNLLSDDPALRKFLVCLVERTEGLCELMTHDQFQSSIASENDISEPKKK